MRKIISIILWAVGGIFFFFSFCVLVPCLFLFSRERTFAIARRLFAILIRLMGIRLVVRGREHITPGKTYLIMGNHQSLFDIFVIPAAIPLCFTGVEAAYHFSIPVWGYLVRKWGVIPIERSHLENAIKSIEKARETLASGMNLAILPEGHRTLTGRMGPFKKGPFHLAKAAGADLLLFGINGLFEYQSKGKMELQPGRVVVTIAPPVPYGEIRNLAVEEIRDFCFEKIKTLSKE
jgi:1-acyl-sn-glycerol-3-phosphate acyltransferase